ncbi:YajG family lipoprotein [Marinomonas balearica]|uniref:Putative lipoprotein n=1 Tax=Marinomonas balearica TaxID=491947 RepID=A0A4R6MGQ2_9GAMM|nr:YajG family lipoprotein [Marinomonas balearica]TDO99980.1 putative lipoprotein [Marinomonas balearica]
MKSIALPLLVSTLILGGCASTTHTINITPTPEVSMNTLTNDKVIDIKVLSSFEGKIGEINTGIGEHADILLSPTSKGDVKAALVEGLKKLGFKPELGGQPPASLTVTISKLSYTTAKKVLKTEATLDYSLSLELKAKNKTYRANYVSQKVDEYGSLPTQEEVQEAMSELSSDTVSRLLNDPNVILLLQK